MKPPRAFTLLELLVVIAIIAVLAVLCAPVLATYRLSRDRTLASNKIRQLSGGLITYATMSSGEIPSGGEDLPTWESAADPGSRGAWYNAIPRLLGKSGVGDYNSKPESFYTNSNLLFIPAAQYPKSRKSRPLFAVSINSKLSGKEQGDSPVHTTDFQNPARTVIFQESGLPGEKTLKGQSREMYDGQSKSYADRTVARYNGQTLVGFADGHVESVAASDIVTDSGKAHNPQVGAGGGTVYWTIDPAADPNE